MVKSNQRQILTVTLAPKTLAESSVTVRRTILRKKSDLSTKFLASGYRCKPTERK